jgi:hypothetical protein
VSDGKTLAIMGAVCLVLGGFALVYSLSVEVSARDFESAPACSPGTQTTNCLDRRPIEITDTGTGRWGEVNTVDFLDEGNPHESHLSFGRYDTSVLRPGASGVATLWHGQYTNLDVAGTDFLTDQNPVAWRGVWILFGVIAIAFAVILWGASAVWIAMSRGTPDDG